jgi:hypothetical protein
MPLENALAATERMLAWRNGVMAPCPGLGRCDGDGSGAGCRNRTRDIQFTKLALYQLS